MLSPMVFAVLKEAVDKEKDYMPDFNNPQPTDDIGRIQWDYIVMAYVVMAIATQSWPVYLWP